MQFLFVANRIVIKSSLSHCRRHFTLSTASWLKSLNNKLEYTQLQRLPVDESLSPTQNQRPRLVKNALFTKNDPTPLQSPQLLSISSAVTDCIDLSTDITNDTESTKEITEIFAGNIDIIHKIIPNCTPYSHCYAGHQFGNFVGQLGDGRAICLGEYINNNKERWEIQLKGAGLTPYSRFADGRSVLRSSIREYLISEAMYYLGIPTTRAGMLITSDIHTVIRDEFYTGNIRPERAAVVLRLSPSFIRFGSFETCSKKGGPSYSTEPNHAHNTLKPLLDYVIEYHYKDIWQQYKNNSVNEMEMYELWWKQLVERSIYVVAQWQCFGFVHGVLNTDNMSILGLTIDYGPFGFMEYFNDEFVPNYSDRSGRYSYIKQVEICQWNLDQLAQILDEANIISYDITKKWIANAHYNELYDACYKQKMISKFGLFVHDADIDDIVEMFFDRLRQTACDYTNAFRALNMLSIDGIDHNGDMDGEDDRLVEYLVNQCATPLQYGIIQSPNKSAQIISLQRSLPNLRKMADSLRQNTEMESTGGLTLKDIDTVLEYFDRKEIPKEMDVGNRGNVSEMSIVEKQEYDRNVWREFVECYRKTVNKQYITTCDRDMDGLLKANAQRIKGMNENNPKYILRNYMLQNCINAAHNGEYNEIELLLRLLQDPFNEQFDANNKCYDCPAPDWAVSDSVSCSS